jgi:hypothetical protein
VEPAGTVTRGSPIPFERVPVTPEDKVAYTRSFVANSPIGGRDPQGGLSATPAEFLTDENIRRLVAYNTFAATMGPTTATPPVVAPDGRLWVERSTRTGTPAMWDVFDRRGRLVSQLTLPASRRLVAVGRANVYLVSADEDGVEHLERYALPTR